MKASLIRNLFAKGIPGFRNARAYNKLQTQIRKHQTGLDTLIDIRKADIKASEPNKPISRIDDIQQQMKTLRNAIKNGREQIKSNQKKIKGTTAHYRENELQKFRKKIEDHQQTEKEILGTQLPRLEEAITQTIKQQHEIEGSLSALTTRAEELRPNLVFKEHH